MREKRTDYRELVELFPQTLFEIDRQGKFTFSNRTGFEAFGYRPEELEGNLDVLDCFVPEDRPLVKRRIQRLLSGGSFPGHEYTALRKDGTTFPVVVSAKAMLVNGEYVGLRGVILNVSEVWRSRDLLEKSEQRYRELLETMNEGLAIVDAEVALTYVNTRLCEMLGYTEKELVGKKVVALLDAENRKVLRKNYVLRRKGRSDSYELAWTRKDGTQLASIMAPNPLYEDDGSFAGSYSVITDVTLLKVTEESLRQREQELEAKTLKLEEVNAALNVLLKRLEQDKRELEERMMANVSVLISPYIAKLKRSGLGDRQRIYLDILENNLNELTAPFVDSLVRGYRELTPAEIRVAALVREGKTSKQIADILALSTRTVEFHRGRIRRKLGLSGREINLRSFLLSLR